MEDIPHVVETVWPVNLRQTVNWLADRANRELTVQFEDVQSPKFIVSEENIILVLPKFLSGGNSGVAGGFKCQDAGTAIRVYFATVNNVIPDGMSVGDAPPLFVDKFGSSGVVCLGVIVKTGSGIEDGEIDSAFLECFATVPDDAEPIFYLVIGSYSGSSVTPGGMGSGVGDQQFNLCGGLGGTPEWGPA